MAQPYVNIHFPVPVARPAIPYVPTIAPLPIPRIPGISPVVSPVVSPSLASPLIPIVPTVPASAPRIVNLPTTISSPNAQSNTGLKLQVAPINSIPLPQAPSVQLPSVQLPSVQLPSVQLPSVQLPRSIRAPSVGLSAPNVQLPSVQLPGVQLPRSIRAPVVGPSAPSVQLPGVQLPIGVRAPVVSSPKVSPSLPQSNIRYPIVAPSLPQISAPVIATLVVAPQVGQQLLPTSPLPTSPLPTSYNLPQYARPSSSFVLPHYNTNYNTNYDTNYGANYAAPSSSAYLPVSAPNLGRFSIPVEEIRLGPWQVDWAARAKEILMTRAFLLDTSKTGTGKTIVQLWLAKQFGLKILVVTTVSGTAVWENESRKYGTPVVDIISYDSLRGVRGRSLNHNYLIRTDYFDAKDQHKVIFTPTEFYRSLLESGTLVVFDEVQHIKNKSDQFKACLGMVSPFFDTSGYPMNSRYALLSASPFDSEDRVIQFLRMMGFITEKLYRVTPFTSNVELENTGIEELISACREMDNTLTAKILRRIPPTSKKNIQRLAFRLYIDVIKSRVSGFMSKPETIEGRELCYNGHYNISQQGFYKLKEALETLSVLMKYDHRTGNFDMQGVGLAKFTETLVALENTLTEITIRLATHLLTENPSSQVICMQNYDSSIDLIMTGLAQFEPARFNGKTRSKERRKIVSDFNDGVRRVIVCNVQTASESLSLQDTRGDHPRTMYIAPSYRMLSIVQAAGRIYRAGLKSDATVIITYAKGLAGLQMKMLDALFIKSKVLAEVTSNEDNTTILPSEYTKYIEP